MKQYIHLFMSLLSCPGVFVLPRLLGGGPAGAHRFHNSGFLPVAGRSVGLCNVRHIIFKDGGLCLQSLQGEMLFSDQRLGTTFGGHLLSAT